MPRAEVLFVGGRAGVGKTSVAAELHAQLAADRIRHCLIEGDNLDLAWPAPWERGLKLAEQNLAAMWGTNPGGRVLANGLHQHRGRAIRCSGRLLAALGGDPVVHVVLLTATDATVGSRLAQREIGSALAAHLDRSRRTAPELEQYAPAWVHRITTDGHTVTETAHRIKSHLRWAPLVDDQLVRD